MTTSFKDLSPDSNNQDPSCSEHGRDVSWLTPLEYSLSTRLSIATVRRYIASGKLPKYQPGGPGCRVLIPRDALHCGAELQAPAESGESLLSQEGALQVDPIKSIISPRPAGPAPHWLGRK